MDCISLQFYFTLNNRYEVIIQAFAGIQPATVQTHALQYDAVCVVLLNHQEAIAMTGFIRSSREVESFGG